MRPIKYIVVHCTATASDIKLESIKNYWHNLLGWKNPGYHYIINYKGEVTSLLSEDKIANGVKDYNRNSIHLSYVGGVDEDGRPMDTRSKEQEISMLKLLLSLKARYPEAVILGHNNFPNVHKACPSFNVAEWLSVM